MICKHCGTTNKDGAKFCHFCGKKLEDTEQSKNKLWEDIPEESKAMLESLVKKEKTEKNSYPVIRKKKRSGAIVGIIMGIAVCMGIVVGVVLIRKYGNTFLKESSSREALQQTIRLESTDSKENEQEEDNIDNENEITEDDTVSSENEITEQETSSLNQLETSEQIDLAYEEVATENGRFYELLGDFTESKGIIYTGMSGNASDIAYVPGGIKKLTIIGKKMYYIKAVSAQSGTMFSSNLDGTDEAVIANQLPLNEPVFIVNSSVYTQNRKIDLENSSSDRKIEFVKKFLTFDSEYAYFINNENILCRSEYSFNKEEILDWGISGETMEWAEIFERYFVYYDNKDKQCSGYSLDTGERVTYPIKTITTNMGNGGNHRWIYGVENKMIVKISVDGKQKKNLYRLDTDNAEIINVTSHVLFFSTDGENGKTVYAFDLRTGECKAIYEEFATSTSSNIAATTANPEPVTEPTYNIKTTGDPTISVELLRGSYEKIDSENTTSESYQLSVNIYSAYDNDNVGIVYIYVNEKEDFSYYGQLYWMGGDQYLYEGPNGRMYFAFAEEGHRLIVKQVYEEDTTVKQFLGTYMLMERYPAP